MMSDIAVWDLSFKFMLHYWYAKIFYFGKHKMVNIPPMRGVMYKETELY